MERYAGVLRQRLEELAHQFRIESANLLRRELYIPDEEWPPRNVECSARQGLIHGKVERGVTHDATPVAQRLGNCLADCDAGILDCMVGIDVKITLPIDGHIDQGMAG